MQTKKTHEKITSKRSQKKDYQGIFHKQNIKNSAVSIAKLSDVDGIAGLDGIHQRISLVKTI